VDAFQAIVLGIVQGLTEFLPISSTGHLLIVPTFLGWGDPGAAFTAVTQLGTMAAVLLYFRADLWRITKTWFKSLRNPELRSDFDARMGWYIGLGTIPIAIFGFVFRDQIETGARCSASAPPNTISPILIVSTAFGPEMTEPMYGLSDRVCSA